jgi:hypothetical protein
MRNMWKGVVEWALALVIFWGGGLAFLTLFNAFVQWDWTWPWEWAVGGRLAIALWTSLVSLCVVRTIQEETS